MPLRYYEGYKTCVIRQKRKEDVLGSPNYAFFCRKSMRRRQKREMKIVDRVEVFISHGYENIAGKINKFLEENAAEIEKVIDIKLSTSPILSSSDTDNQMIIVTVLVHYQIRQEVNDGT